MAPILEITEASFDRQFAINVKGLVFTLQAVAAQMVAQGRGGKIINMASQAGRRGEALVAVYCATKAAVISITQSAGLDLIKHGINVNGIAPGVVDTPMWEQVDALFAKYENLPIGEKKRQVGEAVPSAGWASPRTWPGRPCSSPRTTPTTSSPRRSMSTAATGWREAAGARFRLTPLRRGPISARAGQGGWPPVADSDDEIPAVARPKPDETSSTSRRRSRPW